MNFNKDLKKRLAMTLVLTLLFGLLAAPAATIKAEADTTNPEQPMIYVDYLGLAEGENREPATTPKAIEGFTNATLNGNTQAVFWVGVKLTNLDNVDFIVNGGIKNLEIAFDYNPDYVIPVDNLNLLNSSDYENIKYDAWMTIIENANLGDYTADTTTTTATNKWDSNYYEISGASTPKGDPDTWEDREYVASETWKTQFISITKKANTTVDTNRFKDISTGEGQYVLKIPFRLINVPTDGGAPFVFRLALGPTSFVITSELKGEVGYAWEVTSRTEDEVNAKDMDLTDNSLYRFAFNGDINVFQAEDAPDKLSTLEVSYEEDGNSKISKFFTDDTFTTEITYSEGEDSYYITVPAIATQVSILMGGMNTAPTVQHSDYATTPAITTISSDKITQNADSGKWSADVPLTGTVDRDGFKDKIIITVAGTPYTVHIKKIGSAVDPPVTGEARIILNYGNSPYGEIMKDDTVWRTLDKYKDDPDGRAKWQKDAKAAFNMYSRYEEGYVPVSASAIKSNNYVYATMGWVDIADPANVTEAEKNLISDSAINIDRDETAIFIYNGKTFVDPGFEAYDSQGNAVTELTRKITVYRPYQGSNHNRYLDNNVTADAVTIPNESEDYVITELTNENVAEYIRPDVYEMEYSFYDKATATTVAITRKVVVLDSFGNTDPDKYIGATDLNFTQAMLENGGVVSGFTKGVTIKSSAYRIFVYRVANTNTDNYIGAPDTNAIESYLTNLTPITQLYVELPEN